MGSIASAEEVKMTGAFYRALASYAPKLPPFDVDAFDQVMRGAEEDLKSDYLGQIATNAGYHTVRYNSRVAAIVLDTVLDLSQSSDIRQKAMGALRALTNFTPRIFNQTLARMMAHKAAFGKQDYDAWGVQNCLERLQEQRPSLDL